MRGANLFEKICKILRRILVGLGMAVVPGLTAQGQTILPDPVAGVEVEMGSQVGLDAWVEGFRPRALAAGVQASTFDAAMRGVVFDPKVVERDRNQNEFSKTIWDYLDTAVSEDRVALGLKAIERNRALLERIEAEYGVEKEVVAAVWGLESAYGTYRGDLPVLGSLATLA